VIPPCRFCNSTLTAPAPAVHALDWRCFICGRTFRPDASTAGEIAWLRSEVARLECERVAPARRRIPTLPTKVKSHTMIGRVTLSDRVRPGT
jgi:hypothetical protein